jgi:hypothetical protein
MKTTKKTKRVFPPSVHVYFMPRDKALLQRMKKKAKDYGLSESALCVMALRLGLPLAEKNMKGLLFDVDFQASENAKGSGVFTD